MNYLAFVSTARALKYRTQEKIWRWVSQSAPGQVIFLNYYMTRFKSGSYVTNKLIAIISGFGARIFDFKPVKQSPNREPPESTFSINRYDIGDVIFSCTLTTDCNAITAFVVIREKKFIFLGISLTQCQKQLQEAINLPSDPGKFVPRCKFDGSYEEVQCQNSTGLCWCVDREGKELTFTATNQTVSCPTIGKIFINVVSFYYCYLI